MGGIQNNPSLLFNDGIRTIDFVLVWETRDNGNRDEAQRQREIFEMNLEKEGLQLEHEEPTNLYGLKFVKVSFNNIYLAYIKLIDEVAVKWSNSLNVDIATD